MTSRAATLTAKPRAPKLAERLAERIERDLIRNANPIGTNLGFENDLIACYGVSRSVFREAVSILEQSGLVQMQRGRYGGLTVAATAEDAAVQSLLNYFVCSSIGVEELLFVRLVLEPIALRQAALNTDYQDVTALRALETEATRDTVSKIQCTSRILRQLLNATKNPALIIFIRAINQLSVVIGLYSGISATALDRYASQILALRIPQIETLIAGELHSLTASQFQQIELLRALHHRFPQPASHPQPELRGAQQFVARQFELTGQERQIKQSDVVVQYLLEKIHHHQWREGEQLGYEPELMAETGVSKGVLREAIRVLERLGVVTMEAGRYGGLVISRPQPEATIATARLCLHSLKLDYTQLADTRHALTLAAIHTLALRVQGEGGQVLQPLEDHLARASRDPAGNVLGDLVLTIAELGGNRIVHLFLCILAALSREQELGSPPPAVDLGTHLQQMIAALAGGDSALARRAMILIQLSLRNGPRANLE